jgi:hypothetical protein
MIAHTSLALRGLCLLVVMATGGMWVRSHFVTDHYAWPVSSKAEGFSLIVSRGLETSPGRLIFRERSALM